MSTRIPGRLCSASSCSTRRSRAHRSLRPTKREPLRSAARVYIAAPAAEDCAEFVAAMRASRAAHRPWLTPPVTPDAFYRLLERARKESFDANLARRREDGAIVGFCNVSEIIRGALQGAFVGYGGVAAHAGQGYMTEALGLVLRRAFTVLGLHRLEANIQPSNLASIALASRCGFEREGFSPRYLKISGRWRDHERWAIRSEQWHQRRVA